MNKYESSKTYLRDSDTITRNDETLRSRSTIRGIESITTSLAKKEQTGGAGKMIQF